MSVFNIASNVLHCLGKITIENVPNHTAMPDRLRILAANESEHTVSDIFRGIRSNLTVVIDDIEPLTLETEVNIFTRHERYERNIHPPLVFTNLRLELNVSVR